MAGIMSTVRAYSSSIWATGWTIGVLGFDSRRELGISLFTIASRTALGPTQPPIQWVPGTLPLGLSDRVVNLTTHLHLAPRLKNEWSYTSIPQYAFMAWCSVKAQWQFHLYLYPLVIKRTRECVRANVVCARARTYNVLKP
jgi:hypothetical protein